MPNSNKAGISIVETVVALFILAAIGGALMALNVQIQALSNTSKFKSQAEAQAQKMTEQVRGRKNTGGGISAITNGCYSDPLGVADLSGCTPTNVNTPKYVLISDSNGGKLVKAVVTWKEKGKTYYTEINTYLYDY